MHELWAAGKIGAATSWTMWAVGNIEGQNISITVAAGVCVFVSSLIWWLSAKFQRVDDRLSNIERALQHCPRNQNGVCETKD